MKSVLATLIAASLAGLTNAVQFTNSQFSVLSGVPFTLTWSEASGPVTITLKTGSSTDLKDVEVLTSGATGSSYTWNPPSTLASSTYAFEIQDSTGTPNYSQQFTYAGSAGASVTAASTSVSVGSTAISTTVSTGVSQTSASTISSLVATTVSSNTTAMSNSTTTASSSSASVTSASNSTTSSASTTSASKTSSSSASKTSSSSTSSTSAPNSNGAGALVMPFALPMLIAAGIAYLN